LESNDIDLQTDLFYKLNGGGSMGSMELIVSRRADELSYVTEHFRDLQGLIVVPMFLALFVCLAGAGTRHTSRPLPVSWTMALSASGTFIVALFASEAISRWYKRRFGEVLAGAPGESARRAKLRTLAVRVLIVGVCILVWESSHPSAMVLLYGTMTALFPRCFESVPAVPAIQLRRAAYIATAMLQLTLISLGNLLHPHFTALLSELLTTYLLLYLYDHWLLTRLLGHREEANQ
jgi:hypothetical protein